MRLIPPTGENGSPRAYPLDGVLDLSQVTLNETIELKRVTGMDLQTVYRGLQLLDQLIGVPNSSVLLAMSQNLDLMEAYRALVWIARNRAGDRGPDGSVLTVEQAVDFPFAGLSVESDPGDPKSGDDADPTLPSTGGDRATAGGAKAPKKTRGRSSTTSAAKS